jgi:hypothetical protein
MCKMAIKKWLKCESKSPVSSRIFFCLKYFRKSKHCSQDETRSDAHLQHLARLEYEKLQRQDQAADQKGKESEKEELESRIRKKKDQLSKLKPQLQTILTASLGSSSVP